MLIDDDIVDIDMLFNRLPIEDIISILNVRNVIIQKKIFDWIETNKRCCNKTFIKQQKRYRIIPRKLSLLTSFMTNLLKRFWLMKRSCSVNY